MSTRKIKSALVARRFKFGYKGFKPLAQKIATDVYSINKAKKND